MSDEAREAAVKRLPPHITEDDIRQIVETVMPTIVAPAYDAGVAEGIRQAREVVAWVSMTADTETNEAQQAWMVEELRRRFDQLEER